MATTYFKDTMPSPPHLLRRVSDSAGLRDESLIDGKWRPTSLIASAMAGHQDYVDEITEAQARKLAPAEFTGSR